MHKGGWLTSLAHLEIRIGNFPKELCFNRVEIHMHFEGKRTFPFRLKGFYNSTKILVELVHVQSI